MKQDGTNVDSKDTEKMMIRCMTSSLASTWLVSLMQTHHKSHTNIVMSSSLHFIPCEVNNCTVLFLR